MMIQSSRCSLLWLALAPVLAGCSRTGPEVAGVVTLAGQPLAGARLMFEPLDSSAGLGGALAIADASGVFTIVPHPETGDTLKLGVYAVNVSRKVDGYGAVPPEDQYPQLEAAGQLRESVPAKYWPQPGAPAPLTAIIKEGRNDLVFHLTAD
jgi:hypothetical protein